MCVLDFHRGRARVRLQADEVGKDDPPRGRRWIFFIPLLAAPLAILTVFAFPPVAGYCLASLADNEQALEEDAN